MLLLWLLLNSASVVQEQQLQALQHNHNKQHQSTFLASWDEAEARSPQQTQPCVSVSNMGPVTVL